MSDEKVSRQELEAFAKAFGNRICELESRLVKEIDKLSSQLREPQEIKTEFYRCGAEGCTFVTDDLGEYVEHVIEERLKGLTPTEEMVWGEEKPKIRHSTVKEYLDCPQCFPKAVDALLEHPKFQKKLEELGWQKPEAKPKRKGLGI